MTQKEYIEMALHCLDIHCHGYQTLKEIIRTILKERLSTYDQLNRNGSQLNVQSEALAALNRLQENGFYTGEDGVNWSADGDAEIVRDALQRNYTSRRWKNLGDEPKDGTVFIGYYDANNPWVPCRYTKNGKNLQIMFDGMWNNLTDCIGGICQYYPAAPKAGE